jgi:hypothetical protein
MKVQMVMLMMPNRAPVGANVRHKDRHCDL